MPLVLTHKPTPGRLIVPFGPRPKPTPTSPEIHYGEDWGWYETTTDPIYAPAAGGKVVAYADAGAYGRRMILDYGVDAFGRRLEVWLCHTSRAVAAIGHRPAAGEIVARIGDTGNTVGPHLHMETRVAGVAVDPATFRSSTPAGSTRDPLPTPRKERNDMQLAHIPGGAPDGKTHLFALFGERFYMEFTGQSAANALVSQIGGGSAPVTRSFLDAVKRAQGVTTPVEIVSMPDLSDLDPDLVDGSSSSA